MEAQEEITMGSKEQTNIIKGKRTKRLRPQSPIPFPLCNGEDDTKMSSSEYVDSTEEEEDMANCLILLAQGHSKDQSPKQEDVDIRAIYHKFNSKRFMEAPFAGGGKAGYYVYECKTCSRTFSSFQALGGHRASHKKPKTAVVVEEKRHFFDEEEGQFFEVIKSNNIISSNLTLQLNNHNNNKGGLYMNNNNRAKVHECSICGVEFTSGQALGGHMRRHKGPVGNTGTTLSLAPMATIIETEQAKKQRSILSLDLDLNLSAPEDDHRESKFPFASKQQQEPKAPSQQQQSKLQQPPVLSTPALVGCHY
ncbi:hypothetical protein SLE2022_110620 [Rubroshorea leprosula]